MLCVIVGVCQLGLRTGSEFVCVCCVESSGSRMKAALVGKWSSRDPEWWSEGFHRAPQATQCESSEL